MGDDEGEDNHSENNNDEKVENNNKGPENDDNYLNEQEKEVGNQDNNNKNNNINDNYNNNINNNNGNNKNDDDDFWRTMQTHAYHVLHPLGNLIGIRCRGCGHLVKSHHENEFFNWLCDDCLKNANICTKK